VCCPGSADRKSTTPGGQRHDRRPLPLLPPRRGDPRRTGIRVPPRLHRTTTPEAARAPYELHLPLVPSPWRSPSDASEKSEPAARDGYSISSPSRRNQRRTSLSRYRDASHAMDQHPEGIGAGALAEKKTGAPRTPSAASSTSRASSPGTARRAPGPSTHAEPRPVPEWARANSISGGSKLASIPKPVSHSRRGSNNVGGCQTDLDLDVLPQRLRTPLFAGACTHKISALRASSRRARSGPWELSGSDSPAAAACPAEGGRITPCRPTVNGPTSKGAPSRPSLSGSIGSVKYSPMRTVTAYQTPL
jgi:hypothetical protein